MTPTGIKYNEKELAQRVAGGDENAFRLLYAYWQPNLSSFIFRITKSKELTAEIIQDVFLKLWINREVLSDIENFGSYLFVISRNQAINGFHKALKELKKTTQLDPAASIDIPDTSDEESNRLRSVIDDAIENLPVRQKEIYLMHRYDRFTYKEIAEKLGIGKESVKTHLSLATKSVTHFLKTHTPLFFLF